MTENDATASGRSNEKGVISRRAMVGVSAFAVPTILTTVAAPAYAATGAPATVTATLAKSSVARGSSTTLTVAVKDSAGNPVAGQLVTLTSSDGQVTTASATGTTNASGIYTTTVSVADGATSGTATLTATAAAVSGNATLSYSPPSLALVLTNSTVPRGGSTTVTATITDGTGAGVPGRTVTLSSSDPAVTLAATSGTTDANGQVVTTATVSAGTTGGSSTITATSGTLSKTATLSYLAPGTVTTIASTNLPEAMITSRDSSRIYASTNVTGTQGGTGVYNAVTRQQLAAASTGTYAATQGIVLSRDESRLYLSNGDGRLYIVNPATAATTGSIAMSGRPVQLALTRDGSLIYAACYSPGSVSIVDTATNTVAASISLGVNATRLCLSPDEKSLYVFVLDGRVLMIDVATRTVVKSVSGSGLSSASGIAVSPNGSRLYVANSPAPNSGSVTVIDVTSFTAIANVGIPSWGPVGLSMTPDGSLLYFGTQSGDVVRMNTATNAMTVVTNIGNRGWPGGSGMSANGAYYYMSGRDDFAIRAITTGVTS